MIAVHLKLLLILSFCVVVQLQDEEKPLSLLQTSTNNPDTTDSKTSMNLTKLVQQADPEGDGKPMELGAMTSILKSIAIYEDATTVEQARAKLEGIVLRIVTKKEEPFVNHFNVSDPDSSLRHSGISKAGVGVVMEILLEIQRKYGIEYKVLPIDEKEWGDLNANGSWSGLIGDLINGNADLAAGAMIVRYDRFQHVDYTVPFQDSVTGMMIRSPDLFVDKRFLIITKPFRWDVWAMIACFIVGSGLILKALTIALRYTEVNYSLVASIWVFFSVFVQQGLPVQPRSWTCRTMLAVWWLMALTLFASFTGNMVALFAVDKTKLPFNSAEELVDRVQYGGYKVIMTNDSLTRTLFIKNSKTAVFQRLWREMETNKKVVYVERLADGVKLVKDKPKYVLLGSYESLDVLSATDCKVTVLTTGIIPVWYSLCLRKDSPYTNLFNREIEQFVEKGFIKKWTRDNQFHLAQQKGNRCEFTEKVSAKGVAIDMEDVQGAFWILLGGVIIGSGGLILEFLARVTLWALRSVGLLKPKVKPPLSDTQNGGHRLSSTHVYSNGTLMANGSKDHHKESELDNGNVCDGGNNIISNGRYPDLLNFPNSSVSRFDEDSTNLSSVKHRKTTAMHATHM